MVVLFLLFWKSKIQKHVNNSFVAQNEDCTGVGLTWERTPVVHMPFGLDTYFNSVKVFVKSSHN